MRPPILFLSIAFAIGVYLGLDDVLRGAWYVVVPVLGTAFLVARRAPLGAALGVMGVAGTIWGVAAAPERATTCSGGGARAAIVRLLDPVSQRGGVVDADVQPGVCGGALRLRWPEDRPARGGTE